MQTIRLIRSSPRPLSVCSLKRFILTDVSRPRDCNNMRDEMLLIGCDWDLAHDRLEDQSDRCLQRVADFLR